MSSNFFKNKRAARKHLRRIYFYIKAVDNQIKLSYLWDSFLADSTEIYLYLKDLSSRKLINRNLSVFSINETHFVTEPENLSNYLTLMDPDKVEIIDVSKENSSPAVLEQEEKLEILKPVIERTKTVLSMIMRQSTGSNPNNLTVVPSLCNLTTLFGFILDYPVLYWYKSPDNMEFDFTCLSMVPLTVYKIMGKCARDQQCCQVTKKLDQELFSFSVPTVLSNQTDNAIGNWFSKTSSNCNIENGWHLKLTQKVISLPLVSM